MDTALRPVVPPLPAVVRRPGAVVDPAQEFVTRLRAAAPAFAAAAGAGSAVVREVVPPARHRRARCGVVLRAADGTERDLTFLGPVSRRDADPAGSFEQRISQWLSAGSGREDLVPDAEAPDGRAVDLTARQAPGVPLTDVPAAPPVVVPAGRLSPGTVAMAVARPAVGTAPVAG